MRRNNVIKMNGLLKKGKGSYILLMQNKKARTIEVGQFGTFEFKPGWYLYIGSAFGAGGIAARTARHLRRGKKHHWHVDYFREFADIVEIWSLRSNPVAEHDVAQLLAGMNGATVPIPGFGSRDCKAGCPAHFFHFAKRPRASTLRTALCRKFPHHGPLRVQTISAEADFLLGQQFLNAGRKAALGDSHNDIPASTMNEIEKFAKAVEQILANCGERAWDVMFSEDKPQEKDAILKLSRKSPERQRHRIKEVAEGRSNTIKPQSEDTTVNGIVDTRDFAKLVNRLARTRGDIFGSLWLLETDSDSSVAVATARDILSTVADCKRHARELAEILKLSLEFSGDGWRQKLTKPKHLALLGVPGQLASGLSFIKKNVHDVLCLGEVLQPTAEERTGARDEIIKIIAGSDAICALLNAKPGDTN